MRQVSLFLAGWVYWSVGSRATIGKPASVRHLAPAVKFGPLPCLPCGGHSTDVLRFFTLFTLQVAGTSLVRRFVLAVLCASSVPFDDGRVHVLLRRVVAT